MTICILYRLFCSFFSRVWIKYAPVATLMTVHMTCFTFGGDEFKEYPIADATRAFLEHPEVFYDSAQQQALCLAILSGDLAAVEKACGDGASITAEGRHGVTPLFWGYLSGKMRVFEFLLLRGANPDVPVVLPRGASIDDNVCQFRTGDSVFYMAAKNRLSENWLRTILKHTKPRQWVHPVSGDDLLHAFFASRSGGVDQTAETLDQLIKFGVDLDLQGTDGYTPLRYAIMGDRYDLASRLVKAGASPACYDTHDRQAIHAIAAEYRTMQRHFREYPDEKLRWDASQEKKDWDELIGLLRDKGFKLTDALLDLERAADPQSGSGYMYKRRLARQDRFCCGTGRKLQDTLGDSVEELPPQQ
jgi:hypothetical protein